MDPWTNPLPPQLSPQHSFISLPTFNNADFDYYVLEPDHLREVNDVKQHSHLSPTVHHRVNEQEWILPERRSINYYLSDGISHDISHNPAIIDNNNFGQTELEKTSFESKAESEFSQIFSNESQELRELYDEYMQKGYFHYIDKNEKNIHKSDEEISTSNENEQSDNSDMNDTLMENSKTYDRWTLKEKRKIIQLAEEMKEDGNFNIRMLGQEYLKENPTRSIEAVLRFIYRLVKYGELIIDKEIIKYTNSRIWTDYEINLLKQIIGNCQSCTNVEISERFIKESRQPERSIRAISSQLWKMRRNNEIPKPPRLLK